MAKYVYINDDRNHFWLINNHIFITEGHISVEFSASLTSCLAQTLNKANFSANLTKVHTIKDIAGIKRLDLSQITSTDLESLKKSKSTAVEYEHNISENFSIQVAAEYSGTHVTMPFMLVHKKTGFSFGCEIDLTLNPLELQKNVRFCLILNEKIQFLGLLRSY